MGTARTRARRVVWVAAGALIAAGLAAPPAAAAGANVEATYVDCNYDAATNTMRPVAILHRAKDADGSDNRVSTVMWLYDGATLVDSLSAGELSIDGGYADSGMVDLAPDDVLPVTPWGGTFGRDDGPSLQEDHTYLVKVRNWEFATAEQTIRTFTCKTSKDWADKCSGIDMDQTAFRPSYVKKDAFEKFPNSKSMCEALWLPNADTGFVPQGLALDTDNTAWVSGYQSKKAWKGPGNDKGERCFVVHVSLAAGTQIGDVHGISTPSQDLFCQHGGGAALLHEGLLVVSTKNLWLVDPDTGAYLRHWDLDGLKGSFLVETVNSRIGIGQYNKSDSDVVLMYRTADLLAEGVTTIKDKGASTAKTVAPLSKADVPKLSQGADFSPVTGKLLASASDASCGTLVRKNSEYGFAAGSEEIEYTGTGVHLWAVFEAYSKKYYAKGPVTPLLARFDVGKLTGSDAKKPGCTPRARRMGQ